MRMERRWRRIGTVVGEGMRGEGGEGGGIEREEELPNWGKETG